jgi:hypothetical protein
MSNYNKSDGDSVALPPLDLLKIQILNERNAVMSALQDYYYRRARTKQEPNTALLRSRIITLYTDLEPSVKRWLYDEKKKSDSEFKALTSKIFSDIVDENIKGFQILNYWLDKKKVIRMDVLNQYDRTNVEESNNANGF